MDFVPQIAVAPFSHFDERKVEAYPSVWAHRNLPFGEALSQQELGSRIGLTLATSASFGLKFTTCLDSVCVCIN